MILPSSRSTKLHTLLLESYVPKIINTAVEIGLFRVLAQKALALEPLSLRLESQEKITESLLGVLVAVELIEHEDGVYRLTPEAMDFLVDTSPACQVSEVRSYSGSSGPFAHLLEALKNGPPEFDGKIWSSKEDMLSMEQQQKGGAIQEAVAFIISHPDFKDCRKMCDFAGNSGYFSFALMGENPKLCSHVLDLPGVCALAEELKKEEDYFDRILFRPFDMEKDHDLGEGYDLFFSSHFLYELNVEDSLVPFLRRVYDSMAPGGLFVSNHVAPSVADAPHLCLAIVELMSRCMGYPTHQLSEIDLRAALEAAGFTRFRSKHLETALPYPVLLASAVK